MRIRQILYPQKTLLEDMRVAANIVSDILLELESLTKPDVSLDMLDELTERRIREAGAISFNKGYKPPWASVPFPATLCCSVNHEVCHAPPGGRILREGDIITYDLGIKYRSGCGDAALTVAVGDISGRKQRAMRYGLRALYEGIKVIRAGVPISDIGVAIENFLIPRGHAIIAEYGGHHIGKEMHEPPEIPHKYYKENENVFLKEGSVICLEPMITPGHGRVAISKGDGWTVYCRDRQPCVCFEHMILVTKEGGEVLTKHINE